MSSGQSAPTPYQPANQPGADASFQQGANQLATAGSDLYSSVAPQLAGVTSAVANNPYYGQAQAGAQNAANVATSQVAPQQLAGAQQDTGIAALATQAAPGYANAATAGGQAGYNAAMSAAPTYANAATAGGVSGYNTAMAPAQSAYNTATAGGQAGYNAAASMAPASVGGLLSAIPGLTGGMGAANQILNTGFDPQNALYNQQFAQQQDQANAQSAMSGLGGSPYAAGVANQANTNFNIDWQNAQLARQIQALGAYGTEQGQVTNDLTNLTNSATNNATNLINTGTGALNAGINTGIGALDSSVNTATGALNSGINTGSNALNSGISTATGALNSGINTGIGALSTLGNQAIAGNAAASDLGTAGLNTLAGASQLPYDLALQQQQANLAALQGQVAGTNASLTGTQQAVQDQGTYLNIGQTAAQGAINAANANNAQSNAMSAGLGNLFGDITGMFQFTTQI